MSGLLGGGGIFKLGTDRSRGNKLRERGFSLSPEEEEVEVEVKAMWQMGRKLISKVEEGRGEAYSATGLPDGQG